MGKRLSIKGHPTRGKKVIELLKMMGGDNIYSHWNGDYMLPYDKVEIKFNKL